MEPTLTTLGNYLLRSVLTTASQLFILFAPALILAMVMQLVTNFVNQTGYRLFGVNLFHGLFKFVGTGVHETSHAIFCLLFGHRITQFRPWSPDPLTGTLGSVEHTYNRQNIYQRIGSFFISIGPLIIGPLVLYGIALLLVGSEVVQPLQALKIGSQQLFSLSGVQQLASSIYTSSVALLQALFSPDNLQDWKFYVFLYLTFSIGSSIRLSPADLKNALDGFGYMVGILFVVNLATLWVENFTGRYVIWLSNSYGFYYSILIFAILLNAVVGLALLPLSVLRRRV